MHAWSEAQLPSTTSFFPLQRSPWETPRPIIFLFAFNGILLNLLLYLMKALHWGLVLTRLCAHVDHTRKPLKGSCHLSYSSVELASQHTAAGQAACEGLLAKEANFRIMFMQEEGSRLQREVGPRGGPRRAELLCAGEGDSVLVRGLL